MNFFSVNGSPRLYQINLSDGGVPKLPVPRARITVKGVEGDRQRNPAIHGGRNRAVCLFSLEVIEALQAEGHFIAPGSSGENLTLAGIDWPSLKPGDRLSVGEVVLEVASYTAPCAHNARWFRDGDFSQISHKKYPGRSRVYARVLAEGVVRPGDPVTIDKRVTDQRAAVSSDVRNRS
jgi:MOSC domain-containing protein YiiM